MIKIIRNISIYSPEDLGTKDILISGGKIVALEENINLGNTKYEEIDGTNLIATPGFIDQHVHIIGGGGESGFMSRTPEVTLTNITKYGITTVIGLLGTDGTTRHMESLLAKARGLEEEGISTYIYSGSYEVPQVTLTGSLKRDIILIDKIIGAGEIALGDHRSSEPTVEEISKMVAEARVGGMLSKKAGVVHFHMGDGKNGFDLINEVLENTNIPIHHFRPTHCGRNKKLLKEAISFAKKGGYIDITSSTGSKELTKEKLSPSGSVKYALDKGVELKQISMSSDGNGSMPRFDSEGNNIGLTAASLGSLYDEFKNLINIHDLSIENAIRIVSTNVADSLLLNAKGHIKENYDADINLLDENLEIKYVFSKGKTMIENGKIIVKGMFE